MWNKFRRFLSEHPMGILLWALVAAAAWDYLIKPVADWCVARLSWVFSTAVPSVFNSLVDSLYMEVARYSGQPYSRLIYIYIVFTAFFLWLSYVFRSAESAAPDDDTNQNEVEDDSQTEVFPSQRPKTVHIVINIGLWVLALSIALFAFGYLYLRPQFVTMSATNALRAIEIVAPYISDQEYKELRADFYSIDSRKAYIELYDKLDAIAEEHDASIPARY